MIRLSLPIRFRSRIATATPSRTQRARRAVGVALACVLLLHVGMIVALETVKSHWRDPEYGWRIAALRELDRTRGERKLIVAVGSSRTQMGFRPSVMSDSVAMYNLAQAGSGPVQVLLNVKRMLAAGVKPNAILMEIMPTSLMQDGTLEQFTHDGASRLGLADIRHLESYTDNPSSLYRRWATYRVLPWHTYRFLLLSHWLPGFLPWQNRVDFQWRMLDCNGWLPYPFETIPAETRERGRAHARQQYEWILQNYHISPLPDRAIRDVIQLCRRENIRLAFYRMPESPAFRAWYTPQANATISAYLQDLTREYGTPVVDASDWLPEDAFADGHHLMKPGATAFSERFGKEFLNDWIE